MRLPLEVLAAVRARVGDDYVVGIRFLGDEVIEGGSRIDDAVWFGVRFARGRRRLSCRSRRAGEFEDAQAAQGRRGRLSLHRPVAATSACRR